MSDIYTHPDAVVPVVTAQPIREVLRLNADGRIFWNEREVESDAELREAVIGLSKSLKDISDADRLRARVAELEKWKAVVIDELIVCHTYSAEHDNDPRKAIKDAIRWNCQIVLDPQVSSDAEALIERGRQEMRDKIDALEPVAWLHAQRSDSDVITDKVKHVWGGVAVGREAQYTTPLYDLKGIKE